jgi:exodeoxyribonuclease III
MAFRKKANILLELKPDLAIISECVSLEKLIFPLNPADPKKKIWIGENLNKGIGIFSFSDLEIELHSSYDPEFKYIVPIQVSGNEQFILIAVWAKQNKVKPQQTYIGQVWHAIHKYEKLLSDSVLIIGDFNWNIIWDGGWKYPGNMTEITEFLKGKGITSLYHNYFKEDFGKEKHSTYFMHKKTERPYHIDYCYGSNDFVKRLTNFQVEDYESWQKLSDHTPIICSFSPKGKPLKE